MAADNKYSTVLLELKTHYQETLAKLEAQASQLKTKITSLDTLIDDPLLGSDLLSVLQGEADSLDSKAPPTKANESVESNAEAKSKKAAPKASSSTSKKKSSAPKKSASQAKAKKKKTGSTGPSSRPMLAPYTEMSKITAITQIMQKNAGVPVHVDDLVSQLYGEISADDFKTERDRVYKTMQSGVYKNRWRKNPKEPMRYIFEEKSQAKSKESKPA